MDSHNPPAPLPEVLSRTRYLRALDRLALVEAENERLRTALETDRLTGIKNEQGMERVAGGRAGWYVLVDLNGFKAINDKHGHDAGDNVLREFAEFLRANTRHDDARTCDTVAARLHGDEFAVWTENRAGARRIKTIVRAWRSRLHVEASASAGIGRTLQDADGSMFLDKQRRGPSRRVAPERT